MSVITLRHLEFYYNLSAVPVFADLDLAIDVHWRTGLVGRNGQGKSTLLKLIAGQLIPSAGELDVPTGTRYFPASADPSAATRDVIKDAIAPFRQWEEEMAQCLARGDEPALSRYGELLEQFTRMDGYKVDAAIEREFDAMQMHPRLLARSFGSLSGGEQTRALIVSLFADERTLPLIDEPTNHLDMAGREIVKAYLAGKPGFILVSHDRHFLDGAVDHIVSINRSDVRVNRGNYSRWRRHMDEELLHEQRTRENIEREVKQLKRAARARRDGANSREGDKYARPGDKGNVAMKDTGFIGHRAAKQMKRALSVERRIDHQLEQKRQLLKNEEKHREVRISTRQRASGRLLLLQDVSLGYGGKVLLEKLSLSVAPGDRVAIIGGNGSGKTSLFNAIFGELRPLTGIIQLPAHVTASRAWQQPRWCDGQLREKLDSAGLDETRFRQFMGSFGVGGEVFERDLETFSQGQLKKVDLVRSMQEEADLLLWDEPLNYIDLYSREQIEDAILGHSPTMVFIEHDRRFIDKVATRIVDLADYRATARN